MHIYDAQIAAVTAATPSIHALRLRIPDAAFRFLPGQWVDLSIEVDGATHTAGYSITTSPIHQGEIELAIKASARHPVARWVEHALQGTAFSGTGCDSGWLQKRKDSVCVCRRRTALSVQKNI